MVSSNLNPPERVYLDSARMVSSNLNPPERVYLDSAGMALPNLGSFSSPAAGSSLAVVEDPSKKVRKPYTISKSRESWTEPEHDKFLEALQLFDRDWKKIEAFIGSKSVIQIRSHAQKYFLKVQKSGTNEHLPPPRPKRKAAHPYPQKASKIAPMPSQEISSLRASSDVPDAHVLRRPDSSTLHVQSGTALSVPNCTEKPIQGDARFAVPSLPNMYSSGSNESTLRTRPTVLPDFCQVYSFIGSVFDPNTTEHLQRLKKMDPIDIETVFLLMRNLSFNLSSPDFEDHKKLLSSYEIDTPKEHGFDAAGAITPHQLREAV